jgi:AraC family transcriptional regulator
MKLETVTVEARPFLYVSHTIKMDPDAIRGVMDRSFRTLGAFMGKSRTAPSGPPIALYRDYAGGSVTIDLGFPVSQESLAKAGGEVKAGRTPGGKAMRVIHKGPYAKIRDTYTTVEGEMKKDGIPTPARMWEVYVSDPQKTPEAELLTEIYMPVA